MDEKSSSYLAWSRSSRKTTYGLRLKRWVESTYLRMIEEAAGTGGLSILEIGPGNGEFAQTALGDGHSYMSLERSPELARSLNESGVPCLHADFPGDLSSVGGRSFDCVYCSHVLEHQDTREEAVAFVVAAKELLRPGGLLVINCPNVMSHRFLFWTSDYTHNFVTTPLRVRNLLIDAGFAVVSERRMRLGFLASGARTLVAAAGLMAQPWLVNPVARLLVRGYSGDARVYFKENFTIIAQRPKT